MAAPSAASASAVARPWPCAAPVIERDLPAELTHVRASAPAEWLQVLVQRHAERVVEDVGRHHQRAEGGQRHDLLLRELRGHRLVDLVGHGVRRHGEAPAEGDHRRSQGSRSSRSGFSPDWISSRRKNVEQMRQSVSAGDGVGEDRGEPLAQERLHGVAEGIPRHQRVEGRHRMQQRPLHVGDAGDARVRVVGCLGVRGKVLVGGRRDPRLFGAAHGPPSNGEAPRPSAGPLQRRYRPTPRSVKAMTPASREGPRPPGSAPPTGPHRTASGAPARSRPGSRRG